METDSAGAVKEMVKDRLQAFGLVLVIGLLLLVSLIISAALAALSTWVSIHPEAIAGTWRVLDGLLSVAITTVLFGLIFRFLPDGRLAWRDIWIGALVTAVLFTIGKQVIGLYLGRSALASGYGAAGSVVVLLLWVNCSAQVVLYGAEFTRVIAARGGRKPAPKVFANDRAR